MRRHVGDVGSLAGGVDHDKDVIAPVGEHQVVQNAACGIKEHAIALPPYGQTQHINRHQGFEGKGGIAQGSLGPQDDLTHVADIEQTRRCSGVQMLLQHPGRVLHRHLVARKGHHAAAEGDMKIVQR